MNIESRYNRSGPASNPNKRIKFSSGSLKGVSISWAMFEHPIYVSHLIDGDGDGDGDGVQAPTTCIREAMRLINVFDCLPATAACHICGDRHEQLGFTWEGDSFRPWCSRCISLYPDCYWFVAWTYPQAVLGLRKWECEQTTRDMLTCMAFSKGLQERADFHVACLLGLDIS